MKKLFSLLSLVVLLGISVNVMGADTNTGATPYIGSTHTYSITGTAGNTVIWWVSTGVGTAPAAFAANNWTNDNMSYTDVATLFEVTAGGTETGATATLPVGGVSSIDLKWLASSAGVTYYIHVRETSTLHDGAGGAGCSNDQVFQVIPQAVFDLLAVNTSLTTNSVNGAAEDDRDACWTSDAPTITSVTTKNDGTGTVTFRIDASGIIDAQNWGFTYTLVPTGCTISSIAVADESATVAAPSGAGTTNVAGGAVTITGEAIATNNDFVYVTVNVTDATFTTSDATVALSITAATMETGTSTITTETNALNNGANAALTRPATSIIASDN